MLHEAYMKHSTGVKLSETARIDSDNSSEDSREDGKPKVVDELQDEKERMRSQEKRHRATYRLGKANVRRGEKRKNDEFTFNFDKPHNNQNCESKMGVPTNNLCNSNVNANPNPSLYTFEVPIEPDNFCSTMFWNFFCFFGLLCHKHWRMSEPNATPVGKLLVSFCCSSFPFPFCLYLGFFVC
jgi:hypothetical protein